MSIFEYDDYRNYLKAYIRQLPSKGRGELTRISALLKVNTTWISQIMSGSQDLNSEQALTLSQYLGHTETETEFFSLLVQISRAGTRELENYLKKKLVILRSESLKLSKIITYEKKLTEQQRSIFYSSWIYSAVHIFTSLQEDGKNLDEIATRFRLTKSRASEIVQFLVGAGIITEESGRFKPGIQSTFLEQGSQHLLKHHASWRLKAIQKSENLSETELMVTGQYSISQKDFLKLREQFTETVKNLNKILKDSEPEIIVCLNLDWLILTD
jgi:uncharacterized protein (TIGR02147 family)